MSAWEATAFVNGRNCDKLAFYTKNWLKSISTSNAPHFPNKVYNMHAWFFSQSERLKRRKVDTSTILTTPSLKWRWYHLSTIITVLSVTISLQIVFAHIAFYAYSLAQWRSHVMVLAFLVSLKLCETSMGQHLSPRWGHVILVNGYPVLTTFPWCGRQMDRGTDKWLPKFKFLGWIKNQILLATRLSSHRLAHPWSSAKTYLNLKRRKWRSTRSGGSRTRKILKYSSLKKFQVSRKIKGDNFSWQYCFTDDWTTLLSGCSL